MKGYEKYTHNSENTYSFAHPNDLNENNLLSENKQALLLIDVNQNLLNYLSNNFAGKYTIFTASNGLDALKIAWDNNPSLILSGVSIPGIGGFEICRQLKNNRKLCHIPFIFLIQKNTTGQEIKGYEAGADNVIPLPFDINLLSVQINRLVQNRGMIKEKYRMQFSAIEVRDDSALKDERFVKDMRKILQENLADPDFNVQKLADKMYTSTTQLYRNMKEFTEHTPVEFIRILRLQKAYRLLNQNNITVTEACYQSGFNNVSYFIKCFKKEFGETPSMVMNSYKKDTTLVNDQFSTSSFIHPLKEVVVKSFATH